MGELTCSIWLWILSCLLIGAELLYRRFHWRCVCLCVIVAIISCGKLGHLWLAAVLAHISFAVYASLALWTYWHHHSASAQARADDAVPLYVGKRISLNDTTEKWIVAMKIPADDMVIYLSKKHYRSSRSTGYDYVVMKAISGIIHKQLESEWDITDCYRLNYVGWSNHNVKNRNRRNEIFGDLCYESAIKTALTTTNSTIYTYFKCMMLYRPDTLFVYLFLLFSLFVYQCCSLPIGTVLYSSVTLITAVINFIVMIEISILQPGERFAITGSISYYYSAIKQDFEKIRNFYKSILSKFRNFCESILSKFQNFCESILSKFRNFCKSILSKLQNFCILSKFRKFCKRILSNLFFLSGISIVTSLYYRGAKNMHKVNLTKKPGAAGPKVVDMVVSQIENTKIFDDDHMHDYVRRIARVESKDGLDSTTYRDGYHGGLWQVDEIIFLATQNTTHSILAYKHKLVKKQFDTDWLSIQWKDLRIPLWSGLAACLYMCTVEEEIPSSIDKQADHWNRNYNSKKESPREPEEFVIKVKELLSGISSVTALYYHGAENLNHKVNLTKMPGAAGPEVVDMVVSQIENTKIFDDDHMHDYVRRIARVESKDGLDSTTYRDGYHGGLWQVDEVIFLATQNTTHSILAYKHKLVKKQFDIDWLSIQWKDLRIPLWSGLAACLYTCTVEEEIPSSIDKQADHWNRNYNSKKESPRELEEFVIKVKQLETSAVCYRDIDLFIVLDSSRSITEEKYEIAKKFVVDLLSGFTIGKNNVHVGLVIYGSTVHLQFGLNDSFDQTVIVNKIRNIPYLCSCTATGNAIMLMVDSFTEAKGARPPDLGVPRVGIVLTDGESNHGVDVRTAAQIARDKSIEMFAFGIGHSINGKELLEIAGSQERKFTIDSFDNIDDARALIVRRSCKAGIKAAMNTTYQDSLDSGNSRLFEYAVPEEGITIYVQVTKGKLTLYGSHSNRDPSPVWHDRMFTGIYDHQKIVIPYPTVTKKRDEITKPFYCNLVGMEDSTFSIHGVNGTH